MSLEISLLSPISFFNSLATTLIVANGVPSECAAAAACPPSDSSSYSFAITSVICLMLLIFFLFLQKT